MLYILPFLLIGTEVIVVVETIVGAVIPCEARLPWMIGFGIVAMVTGTVFDIDVVTGMCDMITFCGLGPTFIPGIPVGKKFTT